MNDIKENNPSFSSYLESFYKAVVEQDFKTAMRLLDEISKFNTFLNRSLKETLITAMTQEALNRNSIEQNEKYTMDKIANLKEDGIVLFRNASAEVRRLAQKVVEESFDIKLTELNEKDIFLRYLPDSKIRMNYRDIVDDAEEAVRYRDFDTAIRLLRIALEGPNPTNYVYARLGLNYLKIDQLPLALDYLYIATELNKKSGRKEDFSDLIRRVQMNNYSYYGIRDMNQIIDLFSKGLSLDIILEGLKYNEEQKKIVRLIFAREYYTVGNTFLGDFYCQKVETSGNNSELVMRLLEEIKRDKAYFSHLMGVDYIPFGLLRKK